MYLEPDLDTGAGERPAWQHEHILENAGDKPLPPTGGPRPLISGDARV